MRVQVHVHVEAFLGVSIYTESNPNIRLETSNDWPHHSPIGKLVHVAREMVVADHFVQRIAVAVRIVRLRPVGVLEHDGLPGGAVEIRIQLFDGIVEFFARHRDTLFFAQQFGQVVQNKVVALLGVAARQDVGLLEAAVGEALLGRFVQEGAVDDRNEGELTDAWPKFVVILVLYSKCSDSPKVPHSLSTST